jgi:hypothetical protein
MVNDSHLRPKDRVTLYPFGYHEMSASALYALVAYDYDRSF